MKSNLEVPIVKRLIDKAKKDKLGWGIKYTKKNGCCFACKNGYKPIKYIVGKEIIMEDVDTSPEDCGTGIHLGKDFIGAGNYSVPERIFFCTFNKKDSYGKSNDKWRVGKVKVEKELPLWLGYGPNGKKILSKIGKEITKAHIAKYNPYNATKLPSLEIMRKSGLAQVWNQVGDQVWDQVWNQVGDQVGDQVWDQVGGQVWDQVGGQVRGQVWNQVGDQVWDQVGGQVWNQVGGQVRATSYWAVNIHFNLGISHWFGEFLKLGVMVIFVQGKIKVFGKKGKYLGEYLQKDL